MSTLSSIDIDFARIFDMKTHPRTVVRDALTEHCTRWGFAKEQIDAVIEAAEAERAAGASAGKAIEAGKDKAREIAAKMRAIRTRFGTRDDGPEAA